MRAEFNGGTPRYRRARSGSRGWRAVSHIAFVVALLAIWLCPLRISFAEAIDFGGFFQQAPVETRFLASSRIGSSEALLPLMWQERDQLDRQRERIDELSRRHLGRSLSGTRSDLKTIQEILDARALDDRDRYRLQALGVVLGDVLVAEYGYEWIAYHDELGRNRALRHAATQHIIFPVTAISRRVEAGIDVDISEIFSQLAASGNPDGDRQFADSGQRR